jgi:hypothetical protein
MRHPRVIEQIDGSTGNVIQYNEWWLPALESWAKWILTQNGQMLVTCFAQEEQYLLATFFKQEQIRHKLFRNNFAPKELIIDYGKHSARPDSFIIKIPN